MATMGMGTTTNSIYPIKKTQLATKKLYLIKKLEK